MDPCKILILFFAYSAACLSSPVTKDDPVPAHNGVKMIQPNYLNYTDYPFTVSVVCDLVLVGGGALVGQQWVLTSASVVNRFNTSSCQVRVASNSAYDGGRMHAVTKAVPHPQFAANQSYDVGLLKLDTPVYPKVAAAISNMASVRFEEDGITANMTGFGTGESGQVNKPYLQFTSVTVYGSKFCNRNVQLCAYIRNSGVPCYGDVGDPLFWCAAPQRCLLLGVLTGNTRCNTYNYYVYTDVGCMRGFINSLMNGSE